VVSGAIALYLGRRKTVRPPVAAASLLRLLWLPVAGAILGGMALTLMHRFDPFNFSADLKYVLPADQISRFLFVWWIHCGLYLVLTLGLAVMIARVVGIRRKSA
jgi:hypothetical protein